MSICSSGSSQPKPGLANDIIITGPFAGSLIGVIYPWLGTAISAFTELIQLHLPTFCAADPPADPGLNAADVLALLAFANDPFVAPSFGRISQAIKRAAWTQMCQCTSGGTYTPLPVVTAPTGLPALNPPGVVRLPATTPCWAYDHGPDNTHYPQGSSNNILGWSIDGNPPLYPASLNVTSVNIKISAVAGSPAAGAPVINIQWLNRAGTTVLSTESYTVPYGTPSTHVTPRAPDAAQMLVTWTLPVSPTGTMNQISYAQDVYCNGDAPGGTLTQCCPPDITSTALLQAILSMVTLMQRQAVPFAYLASTVHAGLTGTGTVAVSGILALAASVTTLPTQLAQSAGTPPRVYGLGRLSLATADGYESPIFLESQNQLIVPRSAGLVTSVGYSLQDGAVLTLTELIREP